MARKRRPAVVFAVILASVCGVARHTAAQAPPNGPVGLVWIGLNKPHYGIHGTPEPGTVGHSASHGCVRLTNWDATAVADLVARGTKVVFIE